MYHVPWLDRVRLLFGGPHRVRSDCLKTDSWLPPNIFSRKRGSIT